jgi:hypothetical protein
MIEHEGTKDTKDTKPGPSTHTILWVRRWGFVPLVPFVFFVTFVFKKASDPTCAS